MQRKVPLPGKIFARCILRRRFAGLFGCMARISCQSQPVFGCMARRSCQELAIFPPEATFGMHGAQNLPRIAARERTVAKSCHYQSPENAFRAYPAIAGCLGMHSVDILPSADIRECAVSAYLHCRSSGRATFSTRGSGFRPLAVLWGFGAQHFLCEGVGIPPSRGLTAGNDFESALFRWATMSPLRVLQSCAVLCAEAKSALTFM